MLKRIGWVVLLAAIAGTASASEVCKYFLWFAYDCHQVHTGPAITPELDPASAMGALGLALGALAVIRGRRHVKKKDAQV
jgi:hypothetical protein